MLRSFFAREQGQGLVEYALIITFIALVVIAAVTFFGQAVNSSFVEFNTAFENR